MEAIFIICLILYVALVYVIAQAAENNRGTNFYVSLGLGVVLSPLATIIYTFYQPNHKRDRQHRELIEALRNK